MPGPIGTMFDLMVEAVVESAHYTEGVDGDTYVETYANETVLKVIDKLYDNGYAIIKNWQ